MRTLQLPLYPFPKQLPAKNMCLAKKKNPREKAQLTCITNEIYSVSKVVDKLGKMNLLICSRRSQMSRSGCKSASAGHVLCSIPPPRNGCGVQIDSQISYGDASIITAAAGSCSLHICIVSCALKASHSRDMFAIERTTAYIKI